MGIEIAPDTAGLLRVDNLLDPVYAPLTIYCAFKIKQVSDTADVMDLQPFRLQHWSGTAYPGFGSLKLTIYSTGGSSTSTIRFHINDDEDNSHISQILSEPNVNLDNRWIHMMGVMPGLRGTAKLYLDDENGDTLTGSSPSDLPIDLSGFNDVEYFSSTYRAEDNVVLDSVVIWDTALTDSDFTNLKNNVDPLQISPSSIVYAPNLRTDWASGDIDDQSSSEADIPSGDIPGTWSYSSDSFSYSGIESETYSKFVDYIDVIDGLTGTINSKLDQFLASEGFTSGSINDKMYAWLQDQYSIEGSLSDLFSLWKEDNL